jgi:hypothetical protein
MAKQNKVGRPPLNDKKRKQHSITFRKDHEKLMDRDRKFLQMTRSLIVERALDVRYKNIIKKGSK